MYITFIQKRKIKNLIEKIFGIFLFWVRALSIRISFNDELMHFGKGDWTVNNLRNSKCFWIIYLMMQVWLLLLEFKCNTFFSIWINLSTRNLYDVPCIEMICLLGITQGIKERTKRMKNHIEAVSRSQSIKIKAKSSINRNHFIKAADNL